MTPQPQISIEALGRLKSLDARTVWKHEALDFTPWLLAHAELLGEALGVDLELTEREVGVGAFSVDLVGRVAGNDHKVIVENQLEQTNHSHLGQLLTYAAGLEAAYIVWLTPDFRDEHRRALEWLNEVTREGVSFFGVELELLCVVDSSGRQSTPAPHFKLVAQPNDWQKHAQTLASANGVNNSATSEREQAYHNFFNDLLARIKQTQPGITKTHRAGYVSWMSLPSGRSGILYSTAFTQKGQFRVELYIDAYAQAADNKRLFDAIAQQRELIEREIGEPLAWERLDHAKASRIAVYREGRVTDPPTTLASLKSFALDYLGRFRKVFGPRVTSLAPNFGPSATVIRTSEAGESEPESD